MCQGTTPKLGWAIVQVCSKKPKKKKIMKISSPNKFSSTHHLIQPNSSSSNSVQPNPPSK